MLFIIAVCVLLGDNRPAVAAPVREVPQGERYINNTEKTAQSMRKYLYKYDVVHNSRHWPESDKFAICNWKRVVGDYSVIECTGGEVLVDKTAEVKFYVEALPDDAGVLSAKWYSDANWTEFEGYAKAVPSIRAAVEKVRGEEYTVKIVLKNDAEDESTIYGSEIYYAEWQGKLHEKDMNEDLWTCVKADNQPPPVSPTECLKDSDCMIAPYLYCGRYDEDEQHGITWVHRGSWPATFELEPGEDTDPHFELEETYKGSDRILFRHYKDDTDDAYVYGTSDYEVVQFRVRDIIPTVSEWGMVVMGVLLLTAGTIVYMRRRVARAPV